MNLDHTFYAILCQHRGIRWFAERRLEDACSRAETIKDIRNGEFAEIVAVVAWNMVEHTADDVTEEIAREIAHSLDPSEPISPELFDFIERAAGVDVARGLRVYDRTLTAA